MRRRIENGYPQKIYFGGQSIRILSTTNALVYNGWHRCVTDGSMVFGSIEGRS